MKPRRAMGSVRWMLLAGLIAAAAVTGLLVYRALRPAVSVTEVVEGEIVQAFYATGTVEPVCEYPIRSNTAGLLEQVLVDKGDRVAKGQPLAVVADTGLVFLEKQAEAEVEEKRARAERETSPVLQEFVARQRLTKEM